MTSSKQADSLQGVALYWSSRIVGIMAVGW